MLALLDQGADLRARDSEGKTALGRASFSGQKQVDRIAPDKGRGCKCERPIRQDGFDGCFVSGPSGNGEDALEPREPTSTLRDDHNQTALMCASLKGHKEVVRLLLESGADINVKTKKGYTALSIATDRGHSEVADLILEKKPDLTICDCQSGRSRYY